MYSKTIFAAAALVALAPTTLAEGLGRAIIKNQCDKPIHIWSIADEAVDKSEVVDAGSEYSEEYKTNGNGGGISIKIAFEDSHDDISQFEYTLSPSDNKVFYDLSNIDGYPFQEGGASITPSDDSCPAVTCPAGVKLCTDAYNEPFDDWATKGCSESTDLTLTLCGSETSEKKAKRHARDFRA